MALVRCPEHKIPYNDENPRGCPACAREKEGGGRAAVMRELARAQRSPRRPSRAEDPPPAPTPPEAPTRATRPSQRRSKSTAAKASPFIVTPPPKPPVVEEHALRRLWRRATRRRSMVIGGLAVVALSALWWYSSGPRFVAGANPPDVTGETRPLPIQPNTPVAIVFAALGTQPPKSNPDSPRLARYTYGTDLTIDALNSVVYAITLRIPNRTWQGLRVSMPERTARGALALLGPTEEIVPAPISTPQILEGYAVYPSLEARPRRVLQVQVRPPNGCFDVQVTLQPRAVGVLLEGDRRFAVIGDVDSSPEWVVTEIRVVSRSLRGPYAPGTAC